jgi:hypothetical protein
VNKSKKCFRPPVVIYRRKQGKNLLLFSSAHGVRSIEGTVKELLRGQKLSQQKGNSGRGRARETQGPTRNKPSQIVPKPDSLGRLACRFPGECKRAIADRPFLAARLENSVSTRTIEIHHNRRRTCSGPEIANQPGNYDGERHKVQPKRSIVL